MIYLCFFLQWQHPIFLVHIIYVYTRMKTEFELRFDLTCIKTHTSLLCIGFFSFPKPLWQRDKDASFPKENNDFPPTHVFVFYC